MRSRHGWLLTAAAILALLIPGVVGHDPWKQDEGYTFGIVLEILRSGHWIVPTLAGEPFMEKPPLFYVSAAATARLLSPWLPLHDGARVAAFLYIALGLAFTGLAARKMFGKGRGEIAALLAASCIGLLPHAHELISDTALFAGFAIALCGFAFALERPRLAGALIGSGVGIGFLSKGLVQPAMLGIAAAALPCISRDWRRAAYFKSLAWAALFASPWLVVWPVLLYRESPEQFFIWFWVNNFGRYFGFAHLGADTEPWYYVRSLPWFTFPAGPLAVWTVMGVRRMEDEQRRNVLLLSVIAAAMYLVLATAATARALYAIPLLIPLAILGSVRARQLPAAAGNALAAFGILLGVAAAIAALGLWCYGTANGRPPDIGILAERLSMDFDFPFVLAVVIGAGVLCAVVAFCASHREATWLHRWTAGLALAWGVPMTLLLPWIDDARSFREPFTSMGDALHGAQCIRAYGLGENQRGMLHYVTGLRPAEPWIGDRCGVVIWQRNGAGERPPPSFDGWSLTWEGARAGENDERFFVYEAPGLERAAFRGAEPLRP